MTKTEQAALQELGMDEAALAERTAKVEALARGDGHMTQGKVQAIVAGDPSKALFSSRPENWDALAETVPMKPTRKQRKDAGIPKGPKIAQKPGLLDSTQVSRLRDLIDTQETCRIELESAISGVEFRQGRLDAAQAELDAYLNELQGKG